MDFLLTNESISICYMANKRTRTTTKPIRCQVWKGDFFPAIDIPVLAARLGMLFSGISRPDG